MRRAVVTSRFVEAGDPGEVEFESELDEVEEAATAVGRAVAKLRSVQGPPGVGPVVVYGG